MARRSLFGPQEQSAPECSGCEFHIKGCCFDPKKMVDGFLATPCFGCREFDLSDEEFEE
ncbi:MAG: hypothetical protein ACLFO2_02950 [Candidatus Woesearchaeota archaeon]